MGKFNNDQVSAAVWLATGNIMAIASLRYRLGNLASPAKEAALLLPGVSFPGATFGE